MIRPPLRSTPAVFCDVETTGLGPTAEIIEATVLDVRGRPLFDSLIRPADPYGYIAEEIHGISASQLAAAPAFAEIADQLRSALEGAILVCHNVEFDGGMLSASYTAHGIPAPATAGTMCTMEEAAQLLRPGRRISLSDAMDELRIPRPDGVAHRSGFDAECTRRIWNSLQSKIAA